MCVFLPPTVPVIKWRFPSYPVAIFGHDNGGLTRNPTAPWRGHGGPPGTPHFSGPTGSSRLLKSSIQHQLSRLLCWGQRLGSFWTPLKLLDGGQNWHQRWCFLQKSPRPTTWECRKACINDGRYLPYQLVSLPDFWNQTVSPERKTCWFASCNFAEPGWYVQIQKWMAIETKFRISGILCGLVYH